MKLNISYPTTGAQKTFEEPDEAKLRIFYDKRVSNEIAGDALGDIYKGYIFRISGGNDKEGFPMKQGLLTNTRVKLLMGDGVSCFRVRREGERKKKSVRGCICSADLAIIDLVVVKKGPQEIPGVTDTRVPRKLGPKRASKIRKLFGLTKKDDVRKFVIRQKTKKGTQGPKIQRLVTPARLWRKKHELTLKQQRAEKNKKESEAYKKLLGDRQKERRAAQVAKKRDIKKTVKPAAEQKKA
nr:40S ribosomal protein S6 [Paratrimastix eleionoma]